jgi:cytosol alanyl aminopeptidase
MASSNFWFLGGVALLVTACGTTPTAATVDAPPAAVQAQPAPPMPTLSEAARKPIFRLPADVHPEGEAVQLEVVPDREGFQGTVTIKLRLLAQRDDVWVSARGLKFSSGTLEVGGETLVVRIDADDAVGAALVALPHKVGPGPATLHLSFSGSFDAHLAGLYRVKAADRFYAYTQFEAIDARKAFPCFDEPSFKIPWDVTLTVRTTDVAISNTNVLSEKPAGPGLKQVTFRTTRPLPSYLVAMAVGDFDVVNAPELPPNEIRHRPLQLRGVATKGRGAELAHALHAGAEQLVLLEKWFGLEYPYEKLDFIAVPDFQYGAMENAGAITFSEFTLLVNSKTASERQKEEVAVDLAHEMAHQWFGDLVTMAWWDDLWLNESFASFMEEQIVAAWDPGLRYDLVFLDRIQLAMATDGLARTKPIRPNIVFEPDIFDVDFGVVYLKGAAVIGMFEQFLGAEAFRAAIHDYLVAHADGNATLQDLLAALSVKVSSVGPAFQTFVEQPGVPLVEGQLSCKGGRASVALQQTRYRPLGSDAQDGLWKVPVCARTDGATAPVCSMLGEAKGSLDLGKRACPKWLALNPKAAGYYHWVLPAKTMEPLLAQPAKNLSAAERLSVAGNLTASFASGRMAAGDVVPGLSHLAPDDEPAVAEEPAHFFEGLRFHVVSPDVQPRVSAYAQGLYRPVLDKLGWEPKADESARIREYRGFLVEYLARVGDADVRSRAAALAQKYLGTDGNLHPDAVDANLVGPALIGAALGGNAQLFDAMLAGLGKAQAKDVRRQLLVGLASFQDPSLAARARALTFDARLHTDERLIPLYVQLRVLETHADAIAFEDAHVGELADAVPESHLNFLLAASSGCSAEEGAALEARRKKAQAGSGKNVYALEKAVEETRLCAALVQAQRPKADAFFKKAAEAGHVSSR